MLEQELPQSPRIAGGETPGERQGKLKIFFGYASGVGKTPQEQRGNGTPIRAAFITDHTPGRERWFR